MTSITTVPDEVLELILHHIPCFDPDGPSTRAARLRFLLVCKKWTEILESRLFSSIELYYASGASSTPRIAQLLNFFNVKPALRHYVHHLDIKILRTDSWVHSVLTEILGSCSQLRTFKMKVNMFEAELPALYNRAVQEKYQSLLTRLATMNLKAWDLDGVPWHIVIKALQNHDLPALRLRDSENEGKDPRIPDWPAATRTSNASDAQLSTQMQPTYHRTGRIKRLELFHCNFCLEDISLLTLWPAQLEAFALCTVGLPGVPSQNELDQFLSQHSQTLESLILRYYAHPTQLQDWTDDPHTRHVDVVHLDISRFPKLKHLNTSLHHAVDSRRTRTAPHHRGIIQCTNILGPGLEILDISVSRFDFYRCVGGEFEPERYAYQVDALKAWFEMLQDDVLERKHLSWGSISQLKRIGIFERTYCLANDPMKNWPGDLLQYARELMTPLGIEVIYSFDAFPDGDEWMYPNYRHRR